MERTSYIRVAQVGIKEGKKTVFSIGFKGAAVLDPESPIASMLEAMLDIADPVIGWKNNEQAKADIALAIEVLQGIEIEDK